MTTFPLVRDIESVGEHIETDDCPRCGGGLVLVEPLGIGFGQWWVTECEECGRRGKGRAE